jgi:hypothetical protein
VASRNLPLKTDDNQNLYFRLRDVVTIGLNTSLEPRHPLEMNLCQYPLLMDLKIAVIASERMVPDMQQNAVIYRVALPGE